MESVLEPPLQAFRPRLALAQPAEEREQALRDLLSLGKSAAPLMPEVMTTLKAFYSRADMFGEDARPLELAVFVAGTLLPEAELTDANVATLSHLSRQKRSFPNASEMALAALAKKGLTPTAAPEKKKPDRVAEVREALRSKTGDDLLIVGVLAKNIKSAELAGHEDLLDDVQAALRACAETPPNNHWVTAGLLHLAKMLLPSPRADRALYETWRDASTPTIKSRARACLRRSVPEHRLERRTG